jgi:hypothetical protein
MHKELGWDGTITVLISTLSSLIRILTERVANAFDLVNSTLVRRFNTNQT